MAGNFHEDYEDKAPELPSDQSLGLTFAAIAVVVGVLKRHDPAVLATALGLAAVLAVIALTRPVWLHPLNIAWFRLGRLLHRFTSPLVMGIVYGLVIVPMGLLMRRRHDPLRLARDPAADTYWVDLPAATPAQGGMTRQF